MHDTRQKLHGMDRLCGWPVRRILFSTENLEHERGVLERCMHIMNAHIGIIFLRLAKDTPK